MVLKVAWARQRGSTKNLSELEALQPNVGVFWRLEISQGNEVLAGDMRDSVVAIACRVDWS